MQVDIPLNKEHPHLKLPKKVNMPNDCELFEIYFAFFLNVK